MLHNAADFRAAAREKLAARGWGPAVFAGFVGLALPQLTGQVLNKLILSNPSLKTFVQNLQEGALDHSQLFAGAGIFFSAITVYFLILYYVKAVGTYGIAATGIAVLRGGARYGHAMSGFGKGWRTLLVMGLSEIYVFLWSLLLIVPGIRAAYSYRMIYFIRVDRRELPANAVVAESKRLMDGNRWRLFCLDCSFIGWILVGVLTLGIGLVWVLPYAFTANAAFYEDLLDRDERNENVPPEEA